MRKKFHLKIRQTYHFFDGLKKICIEEDNRLGRDIISIFPQMHMYTGQHHYHWKCHVKKRHEQRVLFLEIASDSEWSWSGKHCLERVAHDL